MPAPCPCTPSAIPRRPPVLLVAVLALARRLRPTVLAVEAHEVLFARLDRVLSQHGPAADQLRTRTRVTELAPSTQRCHHIPRTEQLTPRGKAASSATKSRREERIPRHRQFRVRISFSIRCSDGCAEDGVVERQRTVARSMQLAGARGIEVWS